jgi:hypothetical protein
MKKKEARFKQTSFLKGKLKRGASQLGVVHRKDENLRTIRGGKSSTSRPNV